MYCIETHAETMLMHQSPAVALFLYSCVVVDQLSANWMLCLRVRTWRVKLHRKVLLATVVVSLIALKYYLIVETFLKHIFLKLPFLYVWTRYIQIHRDQCGEDAVQESQFQSVQKIVFESRGSGLFCSAGSGTKAGSARVCEHQPERPCQ